MTRHVFAWDPSAVAVPAVPAGVAPMRRGARACVVCLVLEDFAAVWDRLEDGTPGPCPGPAAPAGRDAELRDTPPPGDPARAYWPTGWEPGRRDPDGHGPATE